MRKVFGISVAAGAALLLVLAAACGATETIEVPGETIVIEKEVIKEVMVPGETVVVEKEVIKEVEVPGETIVIEKEVINREVVIATPSPAEAHFYMAATSPNAKRGGIARIHQHGPAGSYDIFSSTSEYPPELDEPGV